MDRLQKLYDAGIGFQLDFDHGLSGRIFWMVRDADLSRNGRARFYGHEECVEEAHEALWQAAKRAYPDAECFKEEV